MHKLLVLAFAIFISTSCSNAGNGEKVLINGKVENPIAQGEIILEKFETGQVVPVVTVQTDGSGNFQMEVDVSEPGFYRLNVYGQQFTTVVLNKDNLTVEADGQGGKKVVVKGSKDMEYINQLNQYMAGFSQKVQVFNQKYMEARNGGDVNLVESLTEEGMALETSKVNYLKKMAWDMEGSIVPIMITEFFQDKSGEFPFLDSLANKLKGEIPNSTYVTAFSDNLELFRPAVSIGEIAPEISLPNPDGEVVSLSSLRGKYVLLDFWAAWCGPCRRENPNVVAMYNKYHDKGFEVFSVSLDRTKDAWVKAIEKDGLDWTHVSDLKYFQSSAAIRYKVNSIPFALLLDPEGRVIGKNLRGRFLQAKLGDIFGE